jgi:hypothetical protein
MIDLGDLLDEFGGEAGNKPPFEEPIFTTLAIGEEGDPDPLPDDVKISPLPDDDGWERNLDDLTPIDLGIYYDTPVG